MWQTTPVLGFFSGHKSHYIYKDVKTVKFATPLSVAPLPHYWYPHSKSACDATENKYPELCTVVESHSNGRYSSTAKCVSGEVNSQEEEGVGWMMAEYYLTGVGKYKSIGSLGD